MLRVCDKVLRVTHPLRNGFLSWISDRGEPPKTDQQKCEIYTISDGVQSPYQPNLIQYTVPTSTMDGTNSARPSLKQERGFPRMILNNGNPVLQLGTNASHVNVSVRQKLPNVFRSPIRNFSTGFPGHKPNDTKDSGDKPKDTNNKGDTVSKEQCVSKSKQDANFFKSDTKFEAKFKPKKSKWTKSNFSRGENLTKGKIYSTQKRSKKPKKSSKKK